MKIAYDPQVFYEQSYGGPSRYICEIASRISMMEAIQVSVIAPMHINAYLANLPSQIVSGFRLPGTNQLNLYLRAVGMLVGDVMLRKLSPDVIHETYFFPFRTGPKHVRRVLTIYDMIHEKFSSYFTPTDRTSHFKSLSAERADRIICISESTRRDVIEVLGVHPDKISVVHLAGSLVLPVEPPSGKWHSLVNEPFVLYVGNRGRYKNFSRLLQAYGNSLELRKNFRLICFGGGPFSTSEQEAIATLGINSKWVVQAGGSDYLLGLLYQYASVFVYPSLYEGFGIPPLEAMSLGCPVACSDSSSIPEVVGDAGEYFEPTDCESMTSAILRILGSEDHSASLVAKGYQRSQCFSWDRCASDTFDVYNSLI